MVIFIAFIALVIVCTAPMVWAQHILKRHSIHRSDYPGTGGEFARHILDLADLQHVKVEMTEIGDHYDPSDKTVRLEKANMNGKTLTAVVVAAHEVGHALQDRDAYPPLRIRSNFAQVSHFGEMTAKVILLTTPIFSTFNPRLALLSIGIFVVIMLFRVLLHLITLPVEFDASFNRALPILDRGNYLPKGDMNAARSILSACAMTYVAATLFSIVDIIRWFRFWR
ncbi:MAG: zinc metallopeptidase [Methyloligellaceae bacterium]